MRTALAVSSHDGFRIIQFSVQDDHVHLIVEAEDRSVLSRGIQGVAIRVARAVNRVLGRRGAVWGDRYHARALTSPRVVRNAIVYVLMNFKKHGKGGEGIDACRRRRGSMGGGRVSLRVDNVWRPSRRRARGSPGWVGASMV